MVQLEWLLDSVQAKKRSKETTYFFASPKGASAPIIDSGSTDPLQNNDESNQPGTKRGLALDSDDEAPKASLTDEPPKKKKQKGAQKATSIALRVPIDEGLNPRMLDYYQYSLGS